MKKIKRYACAAVLAVYGLANVGPVLAIGISGYDSSGNAHGVLVTSSGALTVSNGGAGTQPTCSKLVFNTLEVATGYVQVVLPANSLQGQVLFYNEGPDDIYFTTYTVTQNPAIFPRPSPFAKFPAGTFWSYDSPTSNVAAVNAESWGGSTYTYLSYSQCGN